MKLKWLILLATLVFVVKAFPQGVINNGNVIKISSGGIIHITGGGFTNTTINGTDGAVNLSGSIYLDGDWTNNTTVGKLTLSGGTVYFDGSSTQYITHNNYRTSFYNLIVNAGADVQVPAQKEVEATNDLKNDGTFTLLSTSDGTASLFYNKDCEENIVVKRYIESGGTTPIHYLSSPVYNADIRSIIDAYNVYWYDEVVASTNLDIGWTRIISGNMVNARGYVAPFNGATSKLLTFTGKQYNTSDITISITYNTTSTPTADGWNLIGNPYPVSINADLFLDDNKNIVGTVFFWDDGDGTIDRGADYAAWNKTGSTSTNAADDVGNMGKPSGTIAIGQAFMVQALSSVSPTPGTDYVTFKNDYKTSNTTSQFFIPDLAEIKRIKLSITSPLKDYNEIVIGFTSEATTGNDRLYDAPKLSGNQFISLYSFIEDDKYTIQGLPDLTNETVVPIGFFTSTEGLYSFKVPLMENFNFSTKVFLEDLELKKSTEIDTASIYQFYTKAGSINDRFLLHFIPNYSSIEHKTLKDYSKVYMMDHQLNIISNCHIKEIQIYDVSGKLIQQVKELQKGSHQIEILAKNGFYFVKIDSDSGSSVSTILVK